MKKLGGYKLIDFGGVDILSSTRIIKGIVKEIEDTNKRIVVCNVKLGDVSVKEMTMDFQEVKEGITEIPFIYLTNTICSIHIKKSNDEVRAYSWVDFNNIVVKEGQLGDIAFYKENGITILDGQGATSLIGLSGLNLENLPTENPQVSGAVWIDNGTLKISSGE